MVAPKGIEGAVKKKDQEVKSTSSSPEPFQEPDGMTTIDLNKSEDCGKESQENRAKLKQRAQIKYVFQLLGVLCSLFLIFIVVFMAAFLNKEYQLFTSIPANTMNSQPSLSNIPSTSTEDIFDLTKIFNQAIFQQRLKTGKYLDDSYDKMDVCRVQQTFEACCDIFKQTDLYELLDYCTVNDMLNALRQYETEARRKRYANYQEFPYEYVGNRFLPASVFQERFANDEEQNFEQRPTNIKRISSPELRDVQVLPNSQLIRPQDPANEFSQIRSHFDKDFFEFALPEQTKNEQIRQHVITAPKQEVLSHLPNNGQLEPTLNFQDPNLPLFPGPIRHENVRVGEFSKAKVIQGNVADNFGVPVNIEPNRDLIPIKIPSPIQIAKKTEDFTHKNSVGDLQKQYSVSNFGDLVKPFSTDSQILNREIAPNLKIFKNNDDLSASIMFPPNRKNEPNSKISKKSENLDDNAMVIPNKGRLIPSSDAIVGIPLKSPLVSKFGDSVKLLNKTEINNKSDDIHVQDGSKLSSRNSNSQYKITNQDNDPFLENSEKNVLVSQFGDSMKLISTNTTNSNEEQPADLHQNLENSENVKIYKKNEHLDGGAVVIPDNKSLTQWNDSESNMRTSVQGGGIPASDAIVGVPQKAPLVSKYGNSVKLVNQTQTHGQLNDTHGQRASALSSRVAHSQYRIEDPYSHSMPDNSQKKLSASMVGDSVLVSTSTEYHNTEQSIDQYPDLKNFPNAKISKENEDFDASTMMIRDNGNYTRFDDSGSNVAVSSQNKSVSSSDVIVGSALKPPLVSKYGDSVKSVNKTEGTADLVNAVISSDAPTTESLVGNPRDKLPILKFDNSEKVISESRINSPPNLKRAMNSSDLFAVKSSETQNVDTGTEKDSIVRASLQRTKSEDTLLENEKYNRQYLEEISYRANSGQDDFRTKNKQLGATEDIQSTQQMFSNPCFYPYMSPYMPLMPNPSRPGVAPMDPGYLKVVPASQPRAQNQPMFVLNPSMVYSIPQTFPPNPFMSPSYFPQMPIQQQVPAVQPANAPIQVTAPGGQYYMCNPIPTPTNNVAGLAQVEVRREASSLQDLISDIEKFTRNNKSRAVGSLMCPLGEHACLDNSKCIKKHHLCDNEVHCDDSSDEMACSCRERVGKLRTCDGYCDCPKCEDEDGCFGCADDEFSCDDWSRFRRSTCIPLVQRCDGVKQCEITGKDELDCSILADHLGNFPLNKVSNAVGFLHRNYKGKWYPTCFGTELWAAEVCQIEAGPSAIIPKAQMTLTPEDYEGLFVSIFPNNKVNIVNTCVQDRATFVECPPLYCGLRFLTDNPYRAQEVDTSIEEMLNDLERAYNLRNVELQDETLGESLKRNGNSENERNSEDDGVFDDFKDKFDTIFRKSESDVNKTEMQLEEAIRNLKRRHTDSRVVGGKPSQPSAWPWLVSIYKNGVFHCAGVLINELWIVTASHCVDRYWQYYYEIQAGTLRRFSYAPMDQRRWAKVVIFHERYDKENLRNDIALMKLSAPIRYNRHVRPICLPSENSVGQDYLKAPSFGTVCTTVGWGATIEHGSDPDHMREVEVPIMKYCRHKEDSDIDEICAGFAEGGKDACQGDSGGPLMCRNPNNNNQWYLAGIVSHGQGCARPGEPGVYTRVSRYIGWIAEHIRENQLIMAYPLQRCPGFVCKGIKRCIAKKRRCDGTIDCLFGDDEMDCDHQYNEIFKHSRKSMITQQLFENLNPQEEEDNSDIVGAAMNSTWTMKNNLMEGFDGLNFRCKVLLQVVPMEKRCDKHFDCEDGTDEVNCSCAHYVKTTDSDAICDGISDCADLSDEHDCLRCNQTQFPCRISHQCIDKSQRCDGKSDCSQNEDELDCVSLTNGLALTLDKDNRPLFHSRGLVTVNKNGVWMTMCLRNNSETSVIASSVCSLLGLNDYMSYTKYTIDSKILMETHSMADGKLSLARKSHECAHCCDGLFVSCSNISTSSTLRYKSLDQASEIYFSPWMVALYSDGVYLCMGTLLDEFWILTSAKCIDNLNGFDKNYTVAVMGKGKMHLSVQGPHDQILRVINSTQVQETDILLLRVESEVKFNRYVQAANIKAQWDGNYKEKCFAMGLNNGKKAIFVELFPIEECMEGYRCFGKKIEDDCSDNNAWIGTIICDSRLGWYPAAVFNEEEGHCGLSSRKKYTSVKFYNNEILGVTSRSVSLPSYVEIPCSGLRCPLGKCLSQERICDGIRDCYNGIDETQELCYQKESKCYLGEQCACPLTDLKCPKSQKCVPKSVFCDGTNDCGNHEDEPSICSCRSYLELTNPEKICDDIVHCADRTDEDPDICDCKPSSYQCGNSNKCVPLSLVCDGQKDCPNGEDEGTCLSMRAPESEKRNAGEVITRTAGIWHSGCFKLAYSSTELNELCAKLGFEGTTGYQLSDKANQTNLASRPVLGLFDVVWLNRVPKRQMKMLMRSSSEPAVSFTKDDSCYRLFLACV
ncbi:uncharacterized protein ndl [Euwallacea fornicatus]|uniref:uncharacterized protein ndl n=1 Tax=Euwallacea fornicatus TaxID=995702 RepID=UPI00338FBC74